MADVKTVAIKLSALHGDFKSAMRESGDAVSSFGKVSTVALAAVALAGVAMARKSADAYVEYGKSIMRLSRISGENIETSSKMNFAAQQSGVSTDKLANGIKFLERSMAAASPGFAQLGVNVRDSDGNLRDVHSVLLETADGFSHMSNGAEKSALALKIFGKSGLDMVPLLNRGAEGIRALENEAQKYGLVLTQDNLGAIQANIKAHREFDAAMQGLQMRVGQDVLPALTTMTTSLTHLPLALRSVITPTLGLVTAMAGLGAVKGKAVDTFQKATAGASGFGNALSGAAMIAIPLALAGIEKVDKAADELTDSMVKGVDFTHGAAQGQAGLKAMEVQVKAMNAEWARMSTLERAAAAPFGIETKRANEQLMEMEKHQAELEKRTEGVAGALGITSTEADKLVKAMGVDLTAVDPGKYIPIFQALADGTITQAEAQRQLRRAYIESSASVEDQAERIKALKDEVKAKNEEEHASLQPQFAAIDAARKMEDARRAVKTAENELAEAHRSVTVAQEGVIRAEERRQKASRDVSTALEHQRDAQQRLNDLLRGPSEDESANIESASIALEEARRRAAGIEEEDPQLTARKNALEVRRAELELQRAQGAHAENVRQAEEDLAAANQAVTDAQESEVDAIRSVDDAQRNLLSTHDHVVDAELRLSDSHMAVGRAALDLDVANRNLALAYDTGEVSIEKSKEALDRWVAQGIITRAEADMLAVAFDGIKTAMDKINPDEILDPIAIAALAVTRTIAAVRAVADLVLAPQDAVAAIEAIAAGANVAAHARGGPLDEGWNVLGEGGPELAYKSGARVRVFPATTSRTMLTAHPPGIAASPQGGVGGYAHHGDIVIGQATEHTAADIVWEQRKLALSVMRR